MRSTKPGMSQANGSGIWQHFSIRDGLPDMKIECLFVDSRGMLWLGTHDRGAIRFDGDRFASVSTGREPAGSGVFSIIEDAAGTLWFGTQGGLLRYDGKDLAAVSPPSGERCRFLWGCCADREGVLWFAGSTYPEEQPVLCRWDGGQLELHPLAGTREKGPTNVQQLAADPAGHIWLDGNGLHRYDGEICHQVATPDALPGDVWSLLPRADGSLWISTTEGLFVHEEGQLTRMHEPFVGPRAVRSLLEDAYGNAWLATRDGRVLRHDSTGFQLMHQLGAELWGNLCLDPRGRLWVGTYGNGLFVYDPTRFQLFGKAQGLPANGVNCLAEDEAGRLWIGTQAGLAGYDGQTFRRLPGSGSLVGRQIGSLLVDSRRRLWIGTLDGHLFYHADGALRLALNTASRCGLTSLAADPEDGIWVGFQHGWRKDGLRRGFALCHRGETHPFPNQVHGSCPDAVGTLLVDPQGTVWAGSSYPDTYEGFCRYDDDGFTAITPSVGLAHGSVLALCEDGDSGLWIGTSSGLTHWDGTCFSTFACEDGLPHAIVTTLARTRDGRLWIGTEGGGICCYDGQVFQTIQLPCDPACNVITAILEDRRGQLWFATRGGLVRYMPQREEPEIAIEEVTADRTYTPEEEIEIPHTAGCLGFRFQGRSPSVRASQLIYRYRLEGQSKTWSQTRQTQVNYPRLQPGTYRFCVQAVDIDLNYSLLATLKLTIIPDPHIVELTQALSAHSWGPIVGTSAALRHAQDQLRQVAPTELTVLILGETGTGKSLAARAVHDLSQRQNGPFIQVNCGAIPDGLVESELFGHEKGAFTGALFRKLGKVELAASGTLFLDEIGDMPLETQVKLLRFLEEHTFERVGGTQSMQADVRIVAATNWNLEQLVAEGKFREDLYYRLRSFPVRLPPLRERRDDISLLTRYFADRFARQHHLLKVKITPAAFDLLRAYDWPGNVRELEHLIQQKILLCREGRIDAVDLAPTISQGLCPASSPSSSGPEEAQTRSPAEFAAASEEILHSFEKQEKQQLEEEKQHIERALEATNWVVYGENGAAQLLAIHPEKLRYRMKKHGLRKSH